MMDTFPYGDARAGHAPAYEPGNRADRLTATEAERTGCVRIIGVRCDRRPLRWLVAVILAVSFALASIYLRLGSPADPVGDSQLAGPQSSSIHTATDCTHSVSSGELPTGGAVAAGGLSFPRSVAPTWRSKSEHRVPNSIDAVTLAETVSDMSESNWIGQLTVGVTNFAPSIPLAEQAALMLKCIIESPLYSGTSPIVGNATARPGRLDGNPTSTIRVPVSVTVEDPTIRGDDVVLVVVGTRPTTYFLSTTPFGDIGREGIAAAALAELRVFAG